MKRIFFTSVILILCLLLTNAAGESSFGLVAFSGKVNTSEIGGRDLYVFSVWNGERKSFVDAQGNFSVNVLSHSRPQKISVRDRQEKIRALALVFSQREKSIILDARSTAFAVVLGDPEVFRGPQDIEKIYSYVSSAPSFQQLVLFLKKNLPTQDLEVLSRDRAYIDLFERCNREIFQEDRFAIRKSLQEAQGKLEEILQP
ncbi:MAG TPA: hypothetical protein PLO93_03010 [Candidatus Omnitrophota bacterium]|nr:hypothetical protein [Candidatus Omnitrophota bacterium]HQL41245.1 hypothetical protein [Candidatus Omnitrophota bacterium]